MKGNTYQRGLLSVVAILCWLSSLAHADTRDLPYQFHPGLRISQTKPPTPRELTGLIRELSSLSGLHLNIDVDGTIRYDSNVPAAGGSATARELLVKAIDNADSVSIERATNSARVAFAQIESTVTYREGTGPRRNQWVIRIDFGDFAELRGDATAIKAFSPGMNFVHELTHAILGLRDPEGPSDQLGQCERYLNLMRTELGLPLRQHYAPKTRWARSPESPAQILQGALNFMHEDPHSKKTEESLVTFNIAMIVDIERVKSKRIPSDLFALVSKN